MAPRIRPTDEEFAAACTEILRWRKSGIYEGEALKAIADNGFALHGDDALRQAENYVLVEAAKSFVASVDRRPSLIDDLEINVPGLR